MGLDTCIEERYSEQDPLGWSTFRKVSTAIVRSSRLALAVLGIARPERPHKQKDPTNHNIEYIYIYVYIYTMYIYIEIHSIGYEV